MAQTVLLLASSLCAGLCGVLAMPRISSFFEIRRHQMLNKIAGAKNTNADAPFLSGGLACFVLKQIMQCVQECQQKRPVQKRPSGSGLNAFAHRFVSAHAQPAGLPTSYTHLACITVAKRHAVLGAAIGIAIWIMANPALGLLSLICLSFLGAYSPFWAIKQEEKVRMSQFEKELPDFIDIVALGLKSGLSFERSIATYAAAFDTPLARACASMQRQWRMGLSNRSDGLMQLAQEFPSKLFKQLLRETAHALRLGTNLSAVYERSAIAARNEYRLKKEETLAKAPVKMMLPISALVLPAMLLMVLGPVLLELFNTL